MKFRISGKDLGIFAIFAVFLLYLCSLITGNISTFGKTGEFSGLSPFPGLSTYLGATIIIFVIFLILIFTSVSSYIFERKKGVGFEIGEKENKGYSRWAKEREMKNDAGVEVVDPLAKDSEFAGIPLVNDGKHLWVDNGQYHNLVIGSTGSGKSQTIVEPMVELLIKKGESMIITDPKGELYRAASAYMKERGYNVVVLNFRDPQNGNAWNPLTLPYQYYKEGNFDKATELLDDVALNILYDPNNKSGDPFWEKSAADYFSGLSLGLFEDAEQDEINLNSINFMSTVGEEKFAASNYIKEYFTLKGEASNAYVFASNTINSPTDTKGGILAVFRQKIRLFASRQNLSEMLSYSDFDLRNIGKEKTAVFIVIHDEKTTYHGLATIFIKQCYETLIDVAQANGGKLPFRTNFILDEFANMPPLKDVTTMVTAARSRSIRFTFIIQNFAQLKSVYGNEDAETIKGNCGNLVYLISTELAALEEISKMCGEVKSSDKDKTASTPLVTVTDLQKLKLFEAIIIRWRLSPFKTSYTPNFKMDWGHPKYDAEFPTRKVREIKLFDVKEFTKKKKSEKIKNSLNEKDGGVGGTNPFLPGNNPFGPKPSNPLTPPSPNPFSNEPKNEGGLFGGLGGGIDLDAMMRDIDKKIAELDAEEARQKEEQAKLQNDKKKEGGITPSTDVPPIPQSSNIPPIPQASPVSSTPSVTSSGLSPFSSQPTPSSGIPPITTPSTQSGDIPTPASEASSLPKTGGVSLLDDRLSGGLFDDEITIPDKPFKNEPVVKDVIPIAKDNEPVVKDVNPVGENKIETSVENSLPKTENINFNDFKGDSLPYNIFDSNETKISLSSEKPNIAVATSSPVEEVEDEYDKLPKVENASIIQPNYNHGTVVKANDDINDYNIYNSVPNIIGSIKDEKTSNLDTNIELPKKEVNIAPELSEIPKEREVIKTSFGPTPQLKTESPLPDPTPLKQPEKTNINIDPDKIVVDNHTISDDEFFDDFFGDE